MCIRDRSSRGLYSLVDWNSDEELLNPAVAVEAYTASWIEMIALIRLLFMTFRRGLYSLVDWNRVYDSMEEGVKGSRLIQPRGLKSQSAFLNTLNPTVEAYTASWIEMF